MWQDLFNRSDLIARLAQGAWNPYLDEFVTFLQQQHYAVNTIRRAVVAADDFAAWALAQRIPLSEVNDALVMRYRQSLGRCEGGSWPHQSRTLPVVVKFLEHKQIVIPHCALPETPAARWLASFRDHLGHVAGLAASTLQRYELTVERFLQERFADAEPDWSQLSAEDLSSFAKREAARRTGFGRKAPVVALRAFPALPSRARLGARWISRGDSHAAPLSTCHFARSGHDRTDCCCVGMLSGRHTGRSPRLFRPTSAGTTGSPGP